MAVETVRLGEQEDKAVGLSVRTGVMVGIPVRAAPAPLSGDWAGPSPGEGLDRSCQARHAGNPAIAAGAISSPLPDLERGRGRANARASCPPRPRRPPS